MHSLGAGPVRAAPLHPLLSGLPPTAALLYPTMLRPVGYCHSLRGSPPSPQCVPWQSRDGSPGSLPPPAPLGTAGSRAGPWVGWGELCLWSCTEALVSAPGAPGGSRGCQRTGSSPGWQVPPGRDANHGPRGRMSVSEMWKEASDHLLRLSPGSRDHLVCGHSLNEVTPLPAPCSFP